LQGPVIVPAFFYSGNPPLPARTAFFVGKSPVLGYDFKLMQLLF
jgi:hypothetical protein